MVAKSTLKQRALDLAHGLAAIRTRDFEAAGVPRVYVQRLCREGLLKRLGRGLYQVSGTDLHASHSLAEASKAVPHGIICLLSALRFHGLTTQAPHQVWMMIGLKKWAPTSSPVNLRIVRATGGTLTAGVEQHEIEGVSVPIYEPAKTVADCFKHRNKVGLDVAIEALRDCLRTRKCTAEQLWRYAKICRVQRIMKPYIEALL